MEIILARHGNTFRSGEPVVWVGSQNDLPLVESGQVQAKTLGKTLRISNQIPTAVYTGPLQRMTTYAKIILDELKLEFAPTIDPRLNEVDYGKWSGLTSQEVRDKFGIEEFENWEKHSKWPIKGEWGESEKLLSQRIRDFANHIAQQHDKDDKILVVASNGCLRYFLDLIPGELQKHINNQTAKIATGNMCQLTYTSKSWKLDFWNRAP
jgi:probable phosphoglycerate mutase